MEDQLESKKLWMALSYVFVDTEIDYKVIAEAARQYSISEIEFAFFERVAPVCVDNMLTPAPSVWLSFDEGQLVSDIESLIRRRAGQGWIGKCMSLISGFFIRLYCKEVWTELKGEIERSRAEE